MCLSHRQVRTVVQRYCGLSYEEAEAGTEVLLATQRGGFQNKRELIDHLEFMEDPESGETNA